MSDEEAPQRPRRLPAPRTFLLLLLGAVFGAAMTLTWTTGPSSRVVAAVVAEVDPSGSAMLVSEPEDLRGVGLGLVGILWQDGDGEWQRTLAADGFPTCVSPDDVGQAVELGLVADPGGLGRPATEVVGWLRCLDDGG